MDLTDPSGKRLLEAFKRVQLLGARPGVGERPFTKFIQMLQDLFNDPVVGAIFGPVLARVIGLDPRVINRLYTEEEERRYNAMTIDEMAQEALSVKYDA
jgi:hypothetical protein